MLHSPYAVQNTHVTMTGISRLTTKGVALETGLTVGAAVEHQHAMPVSMPPGEHSFPRMTSANMRWGKANTDGVVLTQHCQKF